MTLDMVYRFFFVASACASDLAALVFPCIVSDNMEINSRLSIGCYMNIFSKAYIYGPPGTHFISNLWFDISITACEVGNNQT